MDNIREDMKERRITEEDAEDRTKWSNLTHCVDPHFWDMLKEVILESFSYQFFPVSHCLLNQQGSV
jgi:hypothetical protein